MAILDRLCYESTDISSLESCSQPLLLLDYLVSKTQLTKTHFLYAVLHQNASLHRLLLLLLLLYTVHSLLSYVLIT